MKSGFIGIIGRPNAGKLYLIMYQGENVITLDKPQTTRNRITGIYTDLEYDEGSGSDDFLDTPGGCFKINWGAAINETAINTHGCGVDVSAIVDGTKEVRKGRPQ